MKRTLLIIAVLLFTSSLCFAQARNASYLTLSHPRTNVANLGATGLDTEGNPGYIVLTGAATGTGITDNTRPEYYLWIDETGDLCLASHANISTYASFPNGNWAGGNMTAACTKVGGQS